jgi:ATP-dependent DNA helicase RecG
VNLTDRTLDQLPVDSLRGTGPQTLARLQKLNIHSVQDLLLHLPLRYEDRTHITLIGHLSPGLQAQVEGRIELTELISRSRRSLVCRISDGTGFLNLRFFHFTAKQIDQLCRGTLLRCFGEVRNGYYGAEMTHPDYRVLNETETGLPETSLTPVYPLTEGIHQKTLRNLVAQALALVDEIRLPDWLAESVPEPPARPDLRTALHLLHQPPAGCDPSSQTLMRARERLAFEELLAHHLSLSRFRAEIRSHQAPVLKSDRVVTERFLSQLPFVLTQAQRRVMSEIDHDLAVGRPMMRLVQGDVGSGKTVVAAHAALTALASQYQVAIMAPTDLLAEQHLRNFRHWLEPLDVQLAYLSGRLKGEHRQSALTTIAAGQAGVVIGTHALFQEQVVFQRLGLVIIDEQHRFGVHQRLALREKGQRDGWSPHQLIMTATPIPRTLAMLGYADLDLSVIDERPPGRTPVKTTVVSTQRRIEIIARITDWIGKGHQVYWVCTLIEESEVLQCEAAEKTATLLAETLTSVRVALIHGRLKSAEKEILMQSFKAGEIDLLVATTVIEVGVDVPNANLMVIENAERLGLAQLHQLRGRVGRGPGEAHCVLLYQPPLSPIAKQRLSIIRSSDDGFVIAEKDLELRGPGELLGTRQTGQIQFRIADLTRDTALLDTVNMVAEKILNQHPEQVEKIIYRWLGNSTQYVGA